ncbi:hypothetical protein PoMZ_02301 [Pyricularia oryzae]|uniref:Uncharacterized protein n=1 Tax=Pyricularia oryzae TaxID=318829 RepID=A0A4P7N4F3_PYROR|nr:hypothetical protein PoMZ_02301 [Pyricularia oryzae]
MTGAEADIVDEKATGLSDLVGSLKFQVPKGEVGHWWKGQNKHIRPYPLEYTGSRPLSPSQTSEGRTSTQVGDHWGILGVRLWRLSERIYSMNTCNIFQTEVPIRLPLQSQDSGDW